MPARPARPPREPRPAPRPEDRIDFLAVLKAAGIAAVALIILFFGFRALFDADRGALVPTAAKELNPAIDQAITAYNDAVKAASDAQKAADDAVKANAPDAEAKKADAATKKADAETKRLAAEGLLKQRDERIPGSVKILSLLCGLLMICAAAFAAGYLAVRFTRGRKPSTHGAMAAAVLVLVAPIGNTFLTLLEAAALAGVGWMGGQWYIRKNGPWDGVMPERPARAAKPGGLGGLFGAPRRTPSDAETDDATAESDAPPPPARPQGLLGGLFGARARPRRAEPPPDDEPVEGEIVDVEVAPARDEPPADHAGDGAADDLEGPRQFGPAGRKPGKKRRSRPVRRTPDPDDLE